MTKGTDLAARRPTLAQVAARAGVSVSTASLAFSGSGPVSSATRDRVLAAAAELDYAGPDPRARSLRQGRSGIIAVTVDESVRQAFRDPVMIAFLDGIAAEIGREGLSLLLVPGVGEGTTTLESAPIDGAVLMGCGARSHRLVHVARRRNLPVVALGGNPLLGEPDEGGAAIPTVQLDDRVAIAFLTRHVVDLGHRRLAAVTLPLDDSGDRGLITDTWLEGGVVAVTRERIAGVRDVIAPVAEWVAADSLVEEGWTAGRALLGEPDSDGRYRPRADRPTAVVAQSDLLAAGVIQAAEDMGLAVPADLSVVGFDGIRIDAVIPHDLTTMVQPATEQGEVAARMVLDLLAGMEPGSARFTCVFHRGATTAPPR